MASAITHFIVGAALSLPALESRAVREVLPGWAVPVTSGLLAVAPDLDTYLMFALDIPRGSIFAHRGFFHAPLVLVLVAAALAALAAGGRREAFGWLTVMWAGCAITHPLLDALTDGGSGVMLLFPVSMERYFFPWRPIRVSPLGVLRFFSRAGPILRSELPFDVAAAVIGLSGFLLRKMAILG